MAEFVKVAAFQMLPEAQIAIGRLEAEGIPAFMTDAYLVQAMPGTIAQINVLVAPEDEHAARRILGTDYSHDLENGHEEA